MAQLDHASAELLAEHLAELRAAGVPEEEVAVRGSVVTRLAVFLAPTGLGDLRCSDRDRWISAVSLAGVGAEQVHILSGEADAFGDWGQRTGRLKRWRGWRFEIDPEGRVALTEHVRDLRRRGQRPKSIYDRERNVYRYARSIAPTPLLETTEADMERWTDGHIDGGLSASTRRNYLKHVREFLSWTHQREAAERDRPAADRARRDRRQISCPDQRDGNRVHREAGPRPRRDRPAPPFDATCRLRQMTQTVADPAPDPMATMREALAAGTLNAAQTAALDALLTTFGVPPEEPTGSGAAGGGR